jgi:hypothetical protein
MPILDKGDLTNITSQTGRLVDIANNLRVLGKVAGKDVEDQLRVQIDALFSVVENISAAIAKVR